MSKVLSIFSISFLLSTACYAEETSSNVCIYASKPYAPGSILEMAGKKRECRDGYYEAKKQHEAEAAEAHAKGEKYYNQLFYSKKLQWRPVVVESDS